MSSRRAITVFDYSQLHLPNLCSNRSLMLSEAAYIAEVANNGQCIFVKQTSFEISSSDGKILLIIIVTYTGKGECKITEFYRATQKIVVACLGLAKSGSRSLFDFNKKWSISTLQFLWVELPLPESNRRFYPRNFRENFPSVICSGADCYLLVLIA